MNIAVLVAAAVVGLALIRLGQALWKIDSAAPAIRVGGQYSPVLTWLRYHRLPRLIWQPMAWQRVRGRVWVLAELSLIAVWAGWFGQNYLNLNPQYVPAGNEFAMGTQSHYMWDLLGRCGACVFWNGFTNGGVPAFVDLHGAPLHPLVILTTLLWGTVNGAKLTVLACLALAGLAQWWLAQAMQLGRLARLWSAGLAVVSGAVAGRMEVGLVPLALSAAMSALVLAGAVALALGGRRRTAILLGGLLALLLLSGQGYLQVGLALSALPALVILLVRNGRGWRLGPVWKEFLLAAGLAILLSAVLWVPVAHFWPNLGKDTDPGFQSAQPVPFSALNLVINNVDFYYTTDLNKAPYPYLYINYIGIVPVLLALAAVRLVPRGGRRLLVFFLAAIVLVYLAASAISLRALALALPQMAPWVRNPSLIAGLAVPLVLALAAWSVDLLQHNWPRLTLPGTANSSDPSNAHVSIAGLLLAVPLAWSLRSAYDFNQTWLAEDRLPGGERQVVAALQALVPAGQTAWVQPPWGENEFLTPAMAAGMKIASYFRPWHWIGRDSPRPFAEALRVKLWPGDSSYAGTSVGVSLALHQDQPYAAVSSSEGLAPCGASALGGDINVTCNTRQPGQLVVRENSWAGWSVRLDGMPATLGQSVWLTTSAPAGQHTFIFRYRPWDVPLGLGLSLLGVAAAALIWWRAKK